MLILIIFGLFYCLFFAFIFSLFKAGRKADIGEEKIFYLSGKRKHLDVNAKENVAELEIETVDSQVRLKWVGNFNQGK